MITRRWIPICVVFIVAAFHGACAEDLKFDDFESDLNVLGGRSGTYEKAPSRIFATRTGEQAHSGRRSLKMKYSKSRDGGRCGYWNHFKVGNRHFDASGRKTLTFWVKGERGGEDFKVGMADIQWDRRQGMAKSADVSTYLPGGITTDWQQVRIPLREWAIDYKQLAGMAFCCEADSYIDGEQSGTVYIDDIALE